MTVYKPGKTHIQWATHTWNPLILACAEGPAALRVPGGPGGDVAMSETARCAFCGLLTDFESPLWANSVNLTADALFLGFHVLDFVGPLVEVDVAVDWCNVECFGRWRFRAVADSQTQLRPAVQS